MNRGTCAAELATGVCLEFLEAAIHATLHRRGLYPPELFERRSIFGISLLAAARPPALAAYVADFLTALGPLARRGVARQVVLQVLSADATPLEKHVFDFRLLGCSSEAGERQLAPAEAREALAALEQLLSEALQRLGAGDAYLRPLPPGECPGSGGAEAADARSRLHL